MQIEKYLRENQPVVYQTFVNALKNDTLSHAYLLVGNPGTPLFDVAKFLAKSILCDDPSPLACENCITCLRIDSENYPDVIMVDGSKATVKKDDILNIEDRFEKTAMESKGIMIYIINLVENMTVEAVNSMLKFLEEPDAVVYAFLTTNNENNVLPTILSRCQILHLKTIDRNKVIREAMEMGIAQDDAELLSYFYNDAELIFDLLMDKEYDTEEYVDDAEKERRKEEKEEHKKNKDGYLKSKEVFNGLLNELTSGDKRDALYYTDTTLIPLVKTKETLRFFLDMLTEAFEDLLNLQCNREITLKSYDTILRNLVDKLPHINDSLVEILKQRSIVNVNINISLQLDHLVIYITKE